MNAVGLPSSTQPSNDPRGSLPLALVFMAALLVASWTGFIVCASTHELAEVILLAGVAFAGAVGLFLRSERCTASGDNGEARAWPGASPVHSPNGDPVVLAGLAPAGQQLDHLVKDGALVGGDLVLVPAPVEVDAAGSVRAVILRWAVEDLAGRFGAGQDVWTPVRARLASRPGWLPKILLLGGALTPAHLVEQGGRGRW